MSNNVGGVSSLIVGQRKLQEGNHIGGGEGGQAGDQDANDLVVLSTH